MNDIFCRIIAGEIPNYTVYEDEEVLAFLDISQATKGHTLVLPKAHYDDFTSCPKELLAKLVSVAQDIAKAEIEVLGAKGANILSNVGEAAGQSVKHLHIHVVPRYGNDEGFDIRSDFHETEPSEMSEIAKKLSSSL